MDDDPREAMLRPEFRDWYPWLSPDHWYPAQELADHVLEQRRTREPRWEFEPRIPSERHFLFRGGRARNAPFVQSRRSDHLPGTHSGGGVGAEAET